MWQEAALQTCSAGAGSGGSLALASCPLLFLAQHGGASLLHLLPMLALALRDSWLAMSEHWISALLSSALFKR